MVTKREIKKASDLMNNTGIHMPIKDELNLGPMKPSESELVGELTSDEESELPGTR